MYEFVVHVPTRRERVAIGPFSDMAPGRVEVLLTGFQPTMINRRCVSHSDVIQR